MASHSYDKLRKISNSYGNNEEYANFLLLRTKYYSFLVAYVHSSLGCCNNFCLFLSIGIDEYANLQPI
jgi:hypothetical protein